MLRRVALACVCLAGLATLSWVCLAADEGAKAPSISELEAFASMAEEAAQPPAAPAAQPAAPAERAAAQPVAPAAAPTPVAAPVAPAVAATPVGQASEAQSLQEQLSLKERVEREARQTRAAELVARGRYLLHYESNATEAYDLANQALLLDPQNKDALELKTLAGMTAGLPAEERQFEADKMVQTPRVREQSARQALENALAQARELYRQGQYQQAIEKLRNARIIADSLAVYMDVAARRQEIDNLLATVQQDYEKQSREQAAQVRQEATQRSEEWAQRVSEEERLQRARLVEEVTGLIDQKDFDAARKMIDQLEYQDPSDELVHRLRRTYAEAQYQHTIQLDNARREMGDLQMRMWQADQEIVPQGKLDYPNRAFWNDVVERREPQTYPSERLVQTLSPEDQAVYSALDEVYEFRFVDTRLPEVKEYLEQVTPIPYMLYTQDLPPDMAPVTFVMETTLRNALDQITELTGMAWKVDTGMVKIGAPETLRDYEARIYPVYDLLISSEDTTAGGRGRGGGGSRGRGGGGGGGGRTTRASYEAGADEDVSAQFGGAGAAAGAGGRGAAGGGGELTTRSQNLRILVMSLCGEGTWAGGAGVQGGAQAGGAAAARGGAAGGAAPFGPPAGVGGAGGFTGFPGGFTGFGPAAPVGGAAGAAPLALPRGQIFVLPYSPGQMIIYQTAEVHECIEKVFRDLRATMTVMINVDIRTIGLTEDFLREVGFQWNDLILNGSGLATGPFGTLEGFGTMSGRYGSFSPFLVPNIVDVIWVPDPEDPTTGEYQAVYGDPSMRLRSGWGTGTATVDPDTGQITYTVPATSATGSPFIGTGLPYFPALASKGMTMNLGFGSDTFNLSGFFRLAHSKNALRTISAPQVTMMNGQAGEISLDTEEDYVSTYTVEDSVLVPEIDTVTTQNGFWVRPVASHDLRYVFMELDLPLQQTDLSNKVQFETFVGQPGGDGGAAGETVFNFFVLPKIISDQFQTTVGVPDRGVAVMFGNTDSTRTQVEDSLPILGNIPLLKRLFSAEGEGVEHFTRVHLVKPQIILLDEEEAARVR